jgi:hypothetical protein
VYSTRAALSAEGEYDVTAAHIESIDLIDRCIVGTCSPVARQILTTACAREGTNAAQTPARPVSRPGLVRLRIS